MKGLVFDAGPIISLTLNNLLWLLEPLKSRFGGIFYITPEVYRELIDRPLSTHKYKFEALQILPLISKGILTVAEGPKIEKTSVDLHAMANHCFQAQGNFMNIVHKAEMQVLACAIENNCDTVVLDERITRMLIEKPVLLEKHLERKLHTDVLADQKSLKKVSGMVGHLKVIRSFELVTVAFELGLLDIFALKDEETIVPRIREAVLEGVLWGVKLSGCAVREDEIDTVLRLEKSRS
jgi:hypothetical protein